MDGQMNYTGKPPLYYAPFEVALHNQADDCWVSLLGKVLDITSLIATYRDDVRAKPLLAFAGKDVSDWFDAKTNDIRMHIHPVTGCRVPYIPHGVFPDVDVQVPAECWRPRSHVPWWNDPERQIGKLTKRVRPIRIINPAFGLETHLNVCAEDTILRIKERYSIFNSNCNEYIWKFGNHPLYDDKTLEQNGVLDERDHMASVGMDPNFYIPGIMICFSDDLKWVQVSSSDDEDDQYGNYYLKQLCAAEEKEPNSM